MNRDSQKGTPDQCIAKEAKIWRRKEKVAIAAKHDRSKQRAEYAARQVLRKVIDDAGTEP